MTKRLFSALIAFIIVFTSVTLPAASPAHAEDKPGACPKLPVATQAAAAATQAATQAATAAAAESTPAPAKPEGAKSLALSGAFALYPLAQKWGEEYNKLFADVQFDIQAGGAGKGMTDVLAGVTDIALLSRSIRKEETDQGAIAYPVAIDAVVFTINAQNPVLQQIQEKGLPCATLAKIFFGEEKLTWGQIVGTDDASPVNVYTRADSAGAAEQAAKYLGGVAQDDLKGIGVQGDTGLLDAVSKDPYGIGFNNIGFAYDIASGATLPTIAVVPLDQNGNGALEPEEAIYATLKDITTAIAAKKYPSPPARELYLVTKGAAQGLAKDFIKWALTDGQAFVEESGYVKVDSDKIQKALDSLK